MMRRTKEVIRLDLQTTQQCLDHSLYVYRISIAGKGTSQEHAYSILFNPGFEDQLQGCSVASETND